MNTDKKEIQKRIGALTHQKHEIEQELLTLQKEYSEIFKAECEQYIGKCYKQSVEDDDGDVKETYYKVLSFYDDEDDGTQFWVLVVEDHMENDINMPLTYIYKTSINLLGRKKFFLRQLTPISEEEFSKALDEVYKDLVDMNNKVPAKEVESLDLKCPNCDSTGPLIQEDMYSPLLYHPPVWLDGSTINTNPSHDIKTIEYTCEKCGCKFKVKFQGTEIVSIQEI